LCVLFLDFDKIRSDDDLFAFVRKYQKRPELPWDEIFLLVDNDDTIRRDKKWLPLLAYRSDCYKKWSKSYIHRATDFLIIHHKGDILLSKRAEKWVFSEVKYGGNECKKYNKKYWHLLWNNYKIGVYIKNKNRDQKDSIYCILESFVYSKPMC